MLIFNDYFSECICENQLPSHVHFADFTPSPEIPLPVKSNHTKTAI